MDLILHDGRQAVVTCIGSDSAAFDSESQLFLDEALADAGVGGLPSKVRRVVPAISTPAT